MRTIKLLLAAGFLLVLSTSAYMQVQRNEIYLFKLAVKTNALYRTASAPSLGFGIGPVRKTVLDVSGNHNPWKFGDDRQIKHWPVQPGLRYWLCERFNGSLSSLHGHYEGMNVSNLNIFGMGHGRHDGSPYEAGISYRYRWIISKRWSMEATVGIGHARLKYNKYARGDGGEKFGRDTHDCFGPTKTGLSSTYVIE